MSLLIVYGRVLKERAHLDEWCKEVSPSTELRKWYAHDPDRLQNSLPGTRRS